MDLTETLLLAVMAAGWWIPTFIALAELQRRDNARRPLVWKWSAMQVLPVVGYLWYFRRGRAELDAAEEAERRGGAPPTRSREVRPRRGRRG